jgi:hypothetical protein
MASGPTGWLTNDIATQLPTGYVVGFGTLDLDGEYSVLRNGAGPAQFATATIIPHRYPFQSVNTRPGIIQLPGGAVYRAFPDATRSPISWPSWTCEFLVKGSSDGVMMFQNEAAARAGYADNLFWSGANSIFETYSQFRQKRCRAELISVSTIQEYDITTPAPSTGPTTSPQTHCIIAMTWQQLDKFVVQG